MHSVTQHIIICMPAEKKTSPNEGKTFAVKRDAGLIPETVKEQILQGSCGHGRRCLDKICAQEDWFTNVVAERKLRLSGELPSMPGDLFPPTWQFNTPGIALTKPGVWNVFLGKY